VKNVNTEFGLNIELITEGYPVISALMTIECSSCGYRRVFKNVFSFDKMDLVFVTIKIIDWMTCDRCGSLLNTKVEFNI